eukprot:3089865-Prymnesium_polylepis.1
MNQGKGEGGEGGEREERREREIPFPPHTIPQCPRHLPPRFPPPRPPPRWSAHHRLTAKGTQGTCEQFCVAFRPALSYFHV